MLRQFWMKPKLVGRYLQISSAKGMLTLRGSWWGVFVEGMSAFLVSTPSEKREQTKSIRGKFLAPRPLTSYSHCRAFVEVKGDRSISEGNFWPSRIFPLHFQERPPTLENAVFGASCLSAALGAAQGNHRKHRRSRGRGKALPCPILRANAHHVSLRTEKRRSNPLFGHGRLLRRPRRRAATSRRRSGKRGQVAVGRLRKR